MEWEKKELLRLKAKLEETMAMSENHLKVRNRTSLIPLGVGVGVEETAGCHKIKKSLEHKGDGIGALGTCPHPQSLFLVLLKGGPKK